ESVLRDWRHGSAEAKDDGGRECRLLQETEHDAALLVDLITRRSTGPGPFAPQGFGRRRLTLDPKEVLDVLAKLLRRNFAFQSHGDQHVLEAGVRAHARINVEVFAEHLWLGFRLDSFRRAEIEDGRIDKIVVVVVRQG